MGKLPVLKPREVAARLENLGFAEIRQRGSHKQYPYKVNKGTIRFPLSQPVPVKLIERIAKFLAKEASERARAKLAWSKRRR